MRSASRTRSRSACRRSAPSTYRWSGSRSSSGTASCSTCAPGRSCATSTCAARSTRRPPRTATSAATTATSPGSAPTRPRRSARPPAPLLRRRPDEEPLGSLLRNRALVAVQADRELLRGRLCLAHLDLGAGHEALVVEPVQQVAVVLGEADDLRVRARSQIGQRAQLAVLGLLELRVDRPAVRAAVGVAEPLADPFDHVVAEALPDLVGVDVGLGGGVAHEVGQEPLDDPVLADDLLGPLAAGRGQNRLLVLAALDEPVGPEPLQHLAGGRTPDAEPPGH